MRARVCLGDRLDTCRGKPLRYALLHLGLGLHRPLQFLCANIRRGRPSPCLSIGRVRLHTNVCAATAKWVRCQRLSHMPRVVSIYVDLHLPHSAMYRCLLSVPAICRYAHGRPTNSLMRRPMNPHAGVLWARARIVRDSAHPPLQRITSDVPIGRRLVLVLSLRQTHLPRDGQYANHRRCQYLWRRGTGMVRLMAPWFAHNANGGLLQNWVVLGYP